MTQITILEASRLSGKSVKTIYRHIKEGKVSAILNQDNVKVIDLSELSRVYDLKTPITNNNDNLNRISTPLDEIPYLRKELELSHEIANSLKLLLIEKDKRIELLTYTPNTLETLQPMQKDSYMWIYFVLTILLTALSVSLAWIIYL